MKHDLDLRILRQALRADFSTGDIYWLERPRAHFATERDWKIFNGRLAGTLAGCPNKNHRMIHLRYRRRMYLLMAHRVVWALAYGRWPKHEIDHRRGWSNRLDNLREAKHYQNSQNRPFLMSTNTSGFSGVVRHKDRWRAQIGIDYRNKHLGLFDTPEAAHAAYVAAKSVLHPFSAG